HECNAGQFEAAADLFHYFERQFAIIAHPSSSIVPVDLIIDGGTIEDWKAADCDLGHARSKAVERRRAEWGTERLSLRAGQGRLRERIGELRCRRLLCPEGCGAARCKAPALLGALAGIAAVRLCACCLRRFRLIDRHGGTAEGCDLRC